MVHWTETRRRSFCSRLYLLTELISHPEISQLDAHLSPLIKSITTSLLLIRIREVMSIYKSHYTNSNISTTKGWGQARYSCLIYPFQPLSSSLFISINQIIQGHNSVSFSYKVNMNCFKPVSILYGQALLFTWTLVIPFSLFMRACARCVQLLVQNESKGLFLTCQK